MTILRSSVAIRLIPICCHLMLTIAPWRQYYFCPILLVRNWGLQNLCNLSRFCSKQAAGWYLKHTIDFTLLPEETPFLEKDIFFHTHTKFNQPRNELKKPRDLCNRFQLCLLETGFNGGLLTLSISLEKLICFAAKLLGLCILNITSKLDPVYL